MKDSLRKKGLELRRGQTFEPKKLDDQKIFQQLKSFRIFQEAQNILLYYPLQDEINIFEKITKFKKKFYLPVISQNKLIPKLYNSDTKLLKGKYNILVPPKDAKICDPKNLDLIIVPGIIFNQNGHRIGYGKGYYDRFLKDSTAPKIGLCYENQINNDFLPEVHDEKVDYVITEEKIYTC